MLILIIWYFLSVDAVSLVQGNERPSELWLVNKSPHPASHSFQIFVLQNKCWPDTKSPQAKQDVLHPFSHPTFLHFSRPHLSDLRFLPIQIHGNAERKKINNNLRTNKINKFFFNNLQQKLSQFDIKIQHNEHNRTENEENLQKSKQYY